MLGNVLDGTLSEDRVVVPRKDLEKIIDSEIRQKLNFLLQFHNEEEEGQAKAETNEIKETEEDLSLSPEATGLATGSSRTHQGISKVDGGDSLAGRALHSLTGIGGNNLSFPTMKVLKGQEKTDVQWWNGS